MCGLLTVIDHDIPKDKFERAIGKLKHRGPDDIGYYKSDKVILGHTRLSIIDLNSGRQPLFNKDGSIVLTCNGEIYDFEKIRTDLKAKGHKFLTGSDSEVIIHLYVEYGHDMFEHLRGEFAFVLYDKAKGKIIAAKDRFGIKPLFYTQTNEGIVFASELKSIFATGLIEPEVDPVFVRNFICHANFGCFFNNIKTLPPASYLEYDLKSATLEIQQYWSLDLPNYENLKPSKSFEQYKTDLLRHFDEAVRLRLRADVPLGVYLSGGIDSSAIAASAARQTSSKIKAFSISFSDNDQFNESQLAKKMAEHIGAEFHEVKADKTALLDNFEEMLWNAELPTHNMHGVGKFLLSKLARQQVTVCLSGEGADEVFLGYDMYKLDTDDFTNSFSNLYGTQRASRAKQSILEKVRSLKKLMGIRPLAEHVEAFHPLRQWFINSIFAAKHQRKVRQSTFVDTVKKSINKREIEGKGELAEVQYYSLRHVLAPYILTMLGDRQEMAHSLEGRTPFLDHHLFEFARDIPKEYKINNGANEKYILKEAMKERIIPEIYERTKWPYFAPAIPVVKGDHPTMDRLIDTYMNEKSLQDAGIFSPRFIRGIMTINKMLYKWGPRKQVKINVLLTYVLSVQILYSHFCQNGPITES